MGNETTKPSLKPQTVSLSLEATPSISRSECHSAGYKYSGDQWCMIHPEEPSSSPPNGVNVNSLRANIHHQNNNNKNGLKIALNTNYSNTNTLGVTPINMSTLSLDHSQQYSNSSTMNGDHSIIPKITPLELSATDSLSYSQRLGIAADQPIPQLMMNDEEIYNKNQGRKSISEKKKKKKKRIFKFNKNKVKAIDAHRNNKNCEYKDNESEPKIAKIASLSKAKSYTISNVAHDASRRPSVARSRSRPNAKRKSSLNYINYKSRSRNKSPQFSKDVTHSHKLNTRHSKKRRQSIASCKVNLP